MMKQRESKGDYKINDTVALPVHGLMISMIIIITAVAVKVLCLPGVQTRRSGLQWLGALQDSL